MSLAFRPCPVLLLAFGLLAFLASAGPAGAAEGYRPGEVLIRFSRSATVADIAAIRGDLGAVETARLDLIGASRMRVSRVSVDSAIVRYRADRRIDFIEPDYVVHADLVPNDPRFGDLWGMRNTGQSGGTPGADIRAAAGWDIATDAHSVLVAVIDTGVDYTHPDLAANIWTNPGEIPANGVDDDGNGYVDDLHGYDFVNRDPDPMDDHYHGTHVSGTIAARGDNGLGVAGVCWSARIMGCKFLNEGGYGYTSDAVLAIEYATRNGAQVMNNSWGGGAYSEALRAAIQTASDAGVLFVAAAGNDGVDNDYYPHYPASYDVPLIVAVASTDRWDHLSSFSCFGASSVDLAAPGSDIMSTVTGGGYASLSGTSMATPHVSGALALMLARHAGLTGEGARQMLLANVDPLPALSGVVLSGGRLNLAAALAEPDLTPPAAVADLALAGTGGTTATLAWTASGDDGTTGRARRYDLRYATEPITAETYAAATLVSDTPGPGEPGMADTARVRGLAFGTTYWFALRVIDEMGNASEISNVVSGTTAPPPEMSIAPDSLYAGLLTGQRQARTVRIANAGPSDLEFQVTAAAWEPAPLPDRPGVVARGRRVPLAEVARAGLPTRLRPADADASALDRDATPRARVAPAGASARLAGAGEVFGGMENGMVGGWRDRGNLFRCSVDSRLQEQLFYLEPFEPLQVWFLVYEGSGPSGVFTLLSASQTSSYGGAGWYSSGPLDVPMKKDRYYMVLTSWDGYAGYYNQVGVSPWPYPASFGELVGGVGWSWAPATEFPPAPAIEVPVGAFGSAVAYYQALVVDAGLPWLTVEPGLGVVPPGGNLDLAVTFNAAEQVGGDYLGTLRVESNDPLTPLAHVRATLHVTGAADIDVMPAALAYDTVFVGGIGLDTLLVRNPGTDVLHVTLSADEPAFEPDADSLIVPARSSRTVVVRFVPDRATPYAGTLTVQSDDPDEPTVTVALTGVGALPPDIAVAPDSLAADLFAGEQRTRELSVSNLGVAALHFSVTVAPLVPGGVPPRWLRVSPTSGTLAAGASQALQVAFDAAGMYGGDYAAAIRVASEDPDEPVVTVVGRMHVTGAPDIAVTPAYLDFAGVYVGWPKLLALTVANAGTDTLHVAAPVLDVPDFATSEPAFVVPPGGSKPIVLECRARAAGPLNGTLTLLSDDPDEGSVAVPLVAFALEPPRLATSPDSLVSDLYSGGRDTLAVEVRNEGGAELRATVTVLPAGYDVPAAIRPPAGEDTLPSTHAPPAVAVAPRSTPGAQVLLIEDILPWGMNVNEQLLAAGGILYDIVNSSQLAGVDLLRYRLIIVPSVQPNGLYTVLNAQMPRLTAFVALGGVLEFHAAAYGMQVNDPSVVTLPGGLGTVFSCMRKNRVLAPQHPLLEGVPDPFLGEWASHAYLKNLPAGASALTADTLGHPTLAQYGYGAGYVLCSGQALERTYAYGWGGGRILQNLIPYAAALGNATWLKAAPTQLTLAPGGSGTITALLNAYRLYGGDYRAELRLETNDPAAPVRPVPVYMHVTGVADLQVSRGAIDFGLTYLGRPRTETLSLVNAGTDLLHVTGITAEPSVFSVTPAGGAIAPGESIQVAVQFAPADTGATSGTLAIASDDPDEAAVAVALSGTGRTAPHLEVSPDAFSIARTVNLRDTLPITVTNTGGSQLDVTVAIALATAAEVAPIRPPAGEDTLPSTHAPPDVPVAPRSTSGALVLLIEDILPWGMNINEQLLAANGLPYDVVNSSGLAALDLSAYRMIIVPSVQPNALYAVLNEQMPRIADFVARGGVLEFHAAAYGMQVNDPSVVTLPGGLGSVFSCMRKNHVLLPGHPLVSGVPEPFLGEWASHAYLVRLPAGARAITADTLGHPTLVEHSYGAGFVLCSGQALERTCVYNWGGGPILRNLIPYAALLANALWLGAEPARLAVAPGTSAEVSALISTWNVPPGDYHAAVHLGSNDPEHAERQVPVALHVTGMPDLQLSAWSVDFGSVYLGHPRTVTLTMRNAGTDTLHVTSLTAAPGVFGVTPSQAVLGRGDSVKVQVRCEPDEPRTVSGALTILSDDPDHATVEVPLSAVLRAPPRLAFAPDTLRLTALAAGSDTVAIAVSNPGESSLAVDFSVTPSSAAAWLRVEPAHLEVAAGASLDALAIVTGTALTPGDHAATIRLAANDPARPAAEIPAFLHILGVPDIRLSRTAIDFGEVYLGHPRTDSLVVTNVGTEPLTVRSASAAPAQFCVAPDSFRLGSHEALRVHVTCAPTATGTLDGVLTLLSDDPDAGEATVTLHALGLGAPDVAWSPDSLHVLLPSGSSRDTAISLVNEGASTLRWTAEALLHALAVETHPEVPAEDGPGVLGHGGPDVFGHGWHDSDEPEGPAFAWVDITTVGRPLPLQGDNATLAGVPIGFPFPFFGSAFDTVNVCTNGFLSFTSTSSAKLNAWLPTQWAPGNLVAPLWDDLRVGANSIYAWNDDESFVVTYLNAYRSYSGQPFSFQVILHRDGRIVYQYLTAHGAAWDESATVGIQDATGSDGLLVAYNHRYPHDGLAVEFAPWLLDVAPGMGAIEPGGRADVVVHLHAARLTPGWYRTRLDLDSNDPDEGHVELPVCLGVDAWPLIAIAPDTLDFGTVGVGVPRPMPLLVSNVGHELLTVSALESSDPACAPPVGATVIAAGEARPVAITFTASAPGPWAATLTVRSDDPTRPEVVVPMRGTAILAPQVGVSPPAFEETLLPGETSRRDLTIENRGVAPLHWWVEALPAVEAAIVAHEPATRGARPGTRGQAEVAAARAGQAAPPALAAVASGGEPPALADALVDLQVHWPGVVAAIPSRFDFEEGEEGNSILDGGEGMYQGGNLLRTDRGGPLEYSNLALSASTALGSPAGHYFTAKFPGLFVLAADLAQVKSFVVGGNLGWLVEGSVDAAELAATVDGTLYRGYLKRVYGAGTPSVNHLVIVPWSDSTSHTWASSFLYDKDTVSGLASSRRLYYLLYAGEAGAYLDDDAALGIMVAFLGALQPPDWLSVVGSAGETPGGEQASVQVFFDARGRVGDFLGRLLVHSDDPRAPVVTVPASLLVTGPTEVAIAVLSAGADPGVARLTWRAAGCAGVTATVYRRTEAAPWGAVGTVSADGSCELRYEDRDVVAGTRYGYRLGLGAGDAERFAGETWVTVPAGAGFALRGPRTNPTQGDLVVELGLPDAAPATLEVVDVTGRRLAVREVGGLGPGSHAVTLATGLRPGVYVIRLTRGHHTLTARAAVIR